MVACTCCCDDYIHVLAAGLALYPPVCAQMCLTHCWLAVLVPRAEHSLTKLSYTVLKETTHTESSFAKRFTTTLFVCRRWVQPTSKFDRYRVWRKVVSGLGALSCSCQAWSSRHSAQAPSTVTLRHEDTRVSSSFHQFNNVPTCRRMVWYRGCSCAHLRMVACPWPGNGFAIEILNKV